VLARTSGVPRLPSKPRGETEVRPRHPPHALATAT